MTEPPSDAVVRAWTRLERAHRTALGAVQSRLKEAGLPSLEWYDVLLELERAQPAGLRPFELQKALLFAQYNLSRLIDRMEAAGLVARAASEMDGRGQVLHTTRAGRALRRRTWPIYAEAIQHAVGRHFSEAEARTLAILLGRLHGAVD
jgi:DNA-binding MarR family transcriptional regulator